MARRHTASTCYTPCTSPFPRQGHARMGGSWWGLGEAAQLHLSEQTRLALALGWQLLPRV
jgi:hypothetical protein